jgi:hypothetical protein
LLKRKELRTDDFHHDEFASATFPASSFAWRGGGGECELERVLLKGGGGRRNEGGPKESNKGKSDTYLQSETKKKKKTMKRKQS